MLRNLFTPIKINNIEVKNRIALAPMGIGSYNEDETITKDYIDFVKARSLETGLIITTGTRVTNKYGKYKLIGCYDDKFIPSLKKLVEAVHVNGAKIFLQLLALGPADPIEPFVPSLSIEEYKFIEGKGVKPKELTVSQIEEIISEFVSAAIRAKEAGFDGVELFGSEDGLISTFICPHFNKRNDKFGGTFENLMRFPVEILRGIKKKCGKDFPVGFKFNTIHNIADGINLDLGIRIAEKMYKEGIDYIHCWSFETFERPMSTYLYPPMPNLYQPRNSLTLISQKLKTKLPNVPIIVVGGILKPSEADMIIGNNEADIVAVGRGFIAENLWSYKAKFLKEIRPCIRCHVCHDEVAVKGNLISCSVNPDVFTRDVLIITKKQKKVLVIGGGPAGILAAITASNRGHIVKLFEKESEVGGKLIPGSAPDFKHEFKDYLKYLRNELKEAKVEVFKNIEVDAVFLSKQDFNILIIAIGAEPKYPNIKGIESPNIYDSTFALNNPCYFKGKNVVVLGGGEVGCETALFLKRNSCKNVTIVELMDELMKDAIKHNSIILENMLRREGVEIFTGSQVTEIKKDKIKILKNNEVLDDFNTDFIIIASGYKVPIEKLNEFKKLPFESYIIGDCKKPGRLKQAIHDGYNIGNAI